ncbi:MAG: DUF1284 domain-containing protein [Eubacterium sp.]
MLRLRPHHLNCIPRFRGRGYSRAFCENMKEIKERFDGGEAYEIVFSADDICAACPNLVNGICTSREKTDAFDRRTAKYGTGDISKLCAECEWYDICKNNL